MINNKKIVLATQSVSRVDLVRQNALNWECIKNSFDESTYKLKVKMEPNLQSVQNLTMDLALQKALSVRNQFKNTVIIGCDTVVLCKGKILEKPLDLKDAKEMLEYLQNVYQYVITGVALCDVDSGKVKTFCEVTKMMFKDFEEKEYKYLLQDTNPLENAGGYEYNENIAHKTLIVSGTVDNVIGIPLKKVLNELENL